MLLRIACRRMTSSHLCRIGLAPGRAPLPRRAAASFLLGATLLGAACGPRRLEVVAPMSDAATTARSLERTTGLVEPLHIQFAWRLNESGSRMDGVGVARVEPPYRARLDLFLENGETVLSAALVDGELRLPPGAREDILPPLDLMWGALGVFRPITGAELVGGERLEGDIERLRYRLPDGAELSYELADGDLRAVEVLRGDDVVEWVRVTGSGDADGRYPTEAIYRNLADYRELTITRQELHSVDSFDPVIFDPWARP